MSARRKNANQSAPGSSQQRESRAAGMATRHAKMWHWGGALLLVVAVGLTYRDSLGAPFIFDDLATIVHNPSIKTILPLISFSGDYTPLQPAPGSPVHGRPVVNLSLAVNYHFAEFSPRAYRLTNIALHALAAIVLSTVVRRTLRQPFFQDAFATVAEPLAIAAALLWALHPLASECVVYVTQRTEVLMALCYFSTMYAALRYWTAESSGGRAGWLGLAVLCCQLGMLSKETAATIPAVVLLYERTFVAGSFRRALGNSWPLYLGLAVTWLPLVALNLGGPRTPVVGFEYGVSGPEWWFTQCKVLFLYLKLIVWPWPLVIHYAMPYLPSIAAAWPWVIGAAAVATIAIVFLYRGSSLGFVATTSLIVLSPTLVVPIATEVAAERRLYLVLAAIVPWAVAGCYALLRRGLAGNEKLGARASTNRLPLRLTIAGALCVAGGYSVLDMRRVAVYTDEVTLWSDAERHQPDNSLVQVNLGDALEKSGRLNEAILHYERAIELAPNFVGHQSLAGALAAAGRFAEAKEHYEEAIRQRPNMAALHFNYGQLLARIGENDRARTEYEEAFKILPDYRIAYALGELDEAAGNSESARQHYVESLRLNADHVAAHRRLGIVLVAAKQLAEAIEHFEQVVRLEPSSQAYANLAVAFAQDNQPDRALAATRSAVAAARAQGQPTEAARLEAWAKSYQESLASGASRSPTHAPPLSPPAPRGQPTP
jgi:tetratricopeptide (TPR) repeat protein